MLTGRALSCDCTTTNRRGDGSSGEAYSFSRTSPLLTARVDTNRCSTLNSRKVKDGEGDCGSLECFSNSGNDRTNELHCLRIAKVICFEACDVKDSIYFIDWIRTSQVSSFTVACEGAFTDVLFQKSGA
jgi:hypothetical protein